MAAYNPVSYHNGAVWPHDTAIAIAGLMRYGQVSAAQRITAGFLSAAQRMGGRLPELFCGFPRDEFPGPVPYPTSCSPQAWAAAAPLLVVRALLRFDPDLPGDRIWCAPAVPDHLLPLTIRDVALGDHLVALAVDRDGPHVSGDCPARVMTRARQPSPEIVGAAAPEADDGRLPAGRTSASRGTPGARRA
jgi:hypothetical protein